VLVTTGFTQAAPFAEQLDLKMLDSGCVEIDGMGRTSVPGVHAAGDMAHTGTMAMPLASVLTAAGSGLVAASAMTAYLL
jgi:thioredoxin reductase